MTTEESTRETSRTALRDRHVRLGWWMLLLWLGLGIVLEALHGFKVRWYLDVANETRRHLWTLAHAHGVLLALVNIAFGLTVAVLPSLAQRLPRLASGALVGAAVLLPLGFLLGGVLIYDGDPGLGVLVVPLGAVLLFVGVAVTAKAVTSLSRTGAAGTPDAGSKRPAGSRRRRT